MTENAHAIPLAEQPKLITLGDGVFVRQEVDNIAWIDMGDWLLVVDALELAHLEDEVFRLIADTTGGKPVKVLLNTHTHYDHVALNEAFQRRWGTEIVNMKTSALPPDGRWFEGARRRVLFQPMPDCHTSEDCIVWLPDDRILFPGDIFGWGLIPWDRPLTGEKLAHLVETYRRLIAFAATTVVPGHGPLCTTAELQRWIAYVETLITDVIRAREAGLSEDAIIGGALPPPEDMRDWWRFCKWKHTDSVKKVLRAVRLDRL